MTKMIETTATDNGTFIAQGPEQYVELTKNMGKGTFKHLFESAHINAINTAIACQRPLLITGDPGVGKTQLARAAAKMLDRAFVRYTVDAKTESRDLLWQFDAVARLADAQLAQSLKWNEATCEKKLAPQNYLRPGPFWWGFNWKQAESQPRAAAPVQRDRGDYKNGVVVLIDEVDKAEIDVPNGLLEALGDASFQPDGFSVAVRVSGVPPLIVITTNRERGLPDAFVRRCVLLKMELPKEEQALRILLVGRGKAHTRLENPILEEAADLFIKDRKQAKDDKLRYLPGQAEYLDLLRAIEELSGNGYSHDKLLAMVSPYVLRKGDAL
ncbi:MAG: AAA family ATPase [endosymbiont of Escarpia spicata]|uniref:AAA family ATPase n=1 Tax=endosymbiont of Escarpia spicata TaxID=2200908 RepID=A0A370DHJ5_9GAMM|nr:MAG: AAA family ATPase [endosymbiont of Escarpia spicata]